MATETVVFRAVLDGREFTAQVASMGDKVKAAGGAVDAGSGGLKRFQERVEKTATATSGLASAFGGMGNKAGAAFGAVSNLASAFMGGGAVAVGLSLAAAAVGLVVQRYTEAQKAAEDSAKAFAEFSNKLYTDLRDPVRAANEELESLRAQLDALGLTTTGAKQLANERERVKLQESILKGETEIAELRATSSDEELAALNKYNEGMREAAQLGSNSMRGVVQSTLAEQFETAKKSFSLLDKEVSAREEALRADRDRLDILEDQAAVLTDIAAREKKIKDDAKASADEKARERGKKKHKVTGEVVSAVLIDPDTGMTPAEIAASDREQATKRAATHNKMLETMAANEKAWAKEMRESREAEDAAYTEWRLAQKEADIKAGHDQMIAQQERTAGAVDMMKGLWADYYAFIQSGAMSAFSTYLDVVEMAAAGQEIKFEALAASFIKQMGVQLFGIGLQQTFQGAGAILEGTIKNDPKAIGAGVALVSLGTQAMAVGGAMATGGAIASGRISASSGGGGGGGGGRLESRDRERRARGGGVGANGEQSVTIVFNGGTHLGDPTERARSLARDGRRASREVYIPRT